MGLIKIIAYVMSAYLALTYGGYAQQHRYLYDSNGNNVGSSIRAGQNSFYYDGQGNNIGSAMKAGKNTFYYDSQGNNAGSSMPSGINNEE